MKKINIKDEITLLISVILFLIAILIIYLDFFAFIPNKDYSKLKLENVNKLMIVAHPDDESIFGGAHLITDDYLVVCLTCGKSKTRVKEFKEAMKFTHDNYIMLGYRDKTRGQRDDWHAYINEVNKDIEEIINLKDWEVVVTHNPYGEYGHIHHKMTSKVVSKYVSKDKLYYFGMYYSKKSYRKLKEPLPRISDELFKIKTEQLLKIYKSQDFIYTAFDQMFPHENFIHATDWNYKELK